MTARFLFTLCLCIGALLLLAPDAEAYEPYPCETSCSCTTAGACDWLCEYNGYTITCEDYGVCPGTSWCESNSSAIVTPPDANVEDLLDGQTAEEALLADPESELLCGDKTSDVSHNNGSHPSTI